MRRKSIILFVLTSLIAATLCQTFRSKTTTESDYQELNLDPVVEEVVARSDLEETSSKATPPVTTCETENNQPGVCVTYYLCDQDSKTVIEDGYTIIDLRIRSCPNFLDTCCLRNQVVSTTAALTTPAPLTSPAPEITALIDESFDLSEYPDSVSINKPSSVSCGYSNPGAHLFSVREGVSIGDRIYADFGEFPWMVAVLRRSQGEAWKTTDYIGGGSLIHPSVVMTVAHKLTRYKAHQIKIRAGEYDTNSADELYEYQERNVNKIVIHELYYRRSLYNDVGLLFLEAPVTLQNAPHIGIGCLAPKLPPPNTICFSMGWGAENFGNKNVFASVLKKVKLPLLGKDKCEEDLRRTRLGKIFQLHESLVCAGGQEGVDTCRGDGGSSLVCPIDAKGTRFAIYGMVAYGLQCGGKDVPAVYANVPNLYEWIGRQLTKEGLNTKSYTYT